MISPVFRRLWSWSFCSQALRRCYSSGANSAALRPFFLAVHPDFLWQHPSKKEVNERSLKELNQFLDSLQNDVKPDGPRSLQFYLRKPNDDSAHQLVDVRLDGSSLGAVVHSILSSCDLQVPPPGNRYELAFQSHYEEESATNKIPFYRKLLFVKEETRNRRLAVAKKTDLLKFLDDRSSKAQGLILGTNTALHHTMYFSQLVKDRLGLKDIVWDNMWTILHHRNCIEDFFKFSKQYSSHMEHLSGRTVVFGNVCGMHLNGDIVFRCVGSRREWYDLLQRTSEQTDLLLKIWKVEDQITSHLKGTRITHSCFQPALDLGKYLYWAERLSSMLVQSTAKLCFPEQPPGGVIRIALDSNASEMKVLETGVVVVCPHFPVNDIVAFLNSHYEEAIQATESYQSVLIKESKVQEKCEKALCLGFLHKDELLSPENMIQCCQRLIAYHLNLKKLQNLNVCITYYYAVCEDGTVHIPWNWHCAGLKQVPVVMQN